MTPEDFEKSEGMTDTRAGSVAEPEVGSYFVANYPPFSTWTAEAVARDALPALGSAPAGAPFKTPLGLYLHIPFCRKRCHFCYFRVYTNKNASEVEQYLDLLVARVGPASSAAGARRPADRLRVLRRRDAVIPLDAAARRHWSLGSPRTRRGPPPRRSRSSASRAPSTRPSSIKSGASA